MIKDTYTFGGDLEAKKKILRREKLEKNDKPDGKWNVAADFLFGYGKPYRIKGITKETYSEEFIIK